MFADIFEKGSLGAEYQKKLEELRHRCFSCGEKYAGQNFAHLIEENVAIRCRICPSCWLDGSEMYLIATIYARNQKVSRSVIRKMVEWQKLCLDGEFRG
jgi:DNA-directed RNA polymerase subunit RPC12/RpoP